MSSFRRALLYLSLNWIKYSKLWLVIIFLVFLRLDNGCDSLRLRGKFHTGDFFLFLTKFGFQKTESWNKNHTQGYIYGNITDILDSGLAPYLPIEKTNVLTTSKPGTNISTTTSNLSFMKTSSSPVVPILTSTLLPILSLNSTTPSSNIHIFPHPIPAVSKTSNKSKRSQPKLIAYPGTLVVVDKSYFLNFYRTRNLEKDLNSVCQFMFEDISIGNGCSSEAQQNFHRFLRRVPCSKNGICSDENNLTTVVGDSQFTFPIENKNEAKFWYVSLVSCYFDVRSCKWRHSNTYSTIEYDIWLVNGNPYMKKLNPLENQFSFDRQDTVEIYLVFFVCYLILFPLQVHAVLRQKHILTKIFTASVTLELGAVLANVLDVLRFSTDGEGFPRLGVFGDILDILARAIFMLILLVLAKGWAVTRTELNSKPLIFTVWAIYGIINILLYVWNQTEVDVIEDIDEYQTWPGWLALILRTCIMMWFVYELKDTMDHEHQPHKLNFFLHFGAAALVWFIYLPVVALIALQVSPLWRSKLLLGITYSADFFAFAVMTHLLWPTRSQQYFLLSSVRNPTFHDELEEFNEAPHVVNPYARRSNNRLPSNYAIHDPSSLEAVSLTHNNNMLSNSEINGQLPNSFHEDKDNIPLINT